jgi:hypothetical protein
MADMPVPLAQTVPSVPSVQSMLGCAEPTLPLLEIDGDLVGSGTSAATEVVQVDADSGDEWLKELLTVPPQTVPRNDVDHIEAAIFLEELLMCHQAPAVPAPIAPTIADVLAVSEVPAISRHSGVLASSSTTSSRCGVQVSPHSAGSSTVSEHSGIQTSPSAASSSMVCKAQSVQSVRSGVLVGLMDQRPKRYWDEFVLFAESVGPLPALTPPDRHAVRWELPTDEPEFSAVVHATRRLAAWYSSMKPIIFKIGIAAEPEHRFWNPEFGYHWEREWHFMEVQSRGPAQEMRKLETSLISSLGRLDGCRNVKPGGEGVRADRTHICFQYMVVASCASGLGQQKDWSLLCALQKH